MCCRRGQEVHPPCSLSMVPVIVLIAAITQLVSCTGTSWGEGPLAASVAKESPHSPSQAFILLSDGIQIKLHPIYNESLSFALPPVHLDSRRGQERIVHLRTLIVNCDVTLGTKRTRVHLFWLQSKPSRIFHAMVDVDKKQLEKTKLILPNSQTSGTKLPLEITHVSYFDVLSSCGKCDDELTYYLTVVNELTGAITMITLDSDFNVKDMTIAINSSSNPGQISVTPDSLFWLEDSSCLKVISLDRTTTRTVRSQATLPSSIAVSDASISTSKSTSTLKLICINEYSSEAAAAAFHVPGTSGNYFGNYIYLVTSTGDLLRLLPSATVDASLGPSPFQLLFSSTMYGEKDVLRQHATTFNAIQVMHQQRLVKVFLSIKSQGFLLQLTFDCPPDPPDLGDLERFFAHNRSPCRFLGHKNILAERHLFDFAIIDLENSSSRCGNLSHRNGTHPVSKTTNSTTSDSWPQLQNKTITVTMATAATMDRDGQNASSDVTSAITGLLHFNYSDVYSHVPSNRSVDDLLILRPWVKFIALPSFFTIIFIIGLVALCWAFWRGPSPPAPDDQSDGDNTDDDYWSDQQPLTSISANEQVHPGRSNLALPLGDTSRGDVAQPIGLYSGPSLKECKAAVQRDIQQVQCPEERKDSSGYIPAGSPINSYLDPSDGGRVNGSTENGTSACDRRRIRGQVRKSPPKEQFQRNQCNSEGRKGSSNLQEQSPPSFPIAIEDIGDGLTSSISPLTSSTGNLHRGKGAGESGGHWRKMIASTNGTSTNGACGDCSYKSECREKGICLNTYRMLN